MYQHIKFYSEDGKKKTVQCVFRSQRMFERFLTIASLLASHTLFSYDALDENEKNVFSLAVIPANIAGFKRIYNLLYPDLAIK